LFEPEDDLYDGDYQVDDKEFPRILLRFSKGCFEQEAKKTLNELMEDYYKF